MNKYAQVIRTRDEHESTEAISRFAGIFRNGWLIALVTILVTLLGAAYALTTTPLYEASTVIQIKRNPALAGDFLAEDHATTEMEILRSRAVLAEVVQRLQLDVRLDMARPSLVGAVRRMWADDTQADAVPPLEQIRISRFDVPPSLFRRPFILTVTAGQGFSVVNEQLGIRMEGNVGNLVTAGSRYGDIRVLVTRNDAAPGSRFVLHRVAAAQATEQLQHALVVTENAKQSNVIRLALEGADPQLMGRILKEIVNEYMRQRSAEQLGQAGELAASYDRQIAESKAALQNLNSQYARLLERAGIGDPEAEGQALVQQSSALELQLASAQQRKAELSGRYGDGHPAVEAINRQIADATRNLSRNAARRESLAVASRELANVRRDRQALDERTLALFNQRSKLDAVIAAARGDVRLLDQPEAPLQAVTPGVTTMIALSCFGGIALGLFASLLKNALMQHRRARLAPQRETRFRLISLGRTESSGTS